MPPHIQHRHPVFPTVIQSQWPRRSNNNNNCQLTTPPGIPHRSSPESRLSRPLWQPQTRTRPFRSIPLARAPPPPITDAPHHDNSSSPATTHRPRKTPRDFDASRYSTRLIALKLAYVGSAYGGFEYHGNDTALPTVEEILFSALLKSRLVSSQPGHPQPTSPEAWPGDEAVEYSKCGRTDRGVSAFGQVVGVRVRSNRPLPRSMDTNEEGKSRGKGEHEEPKPFDDVADEMPYTQILNRLLPPTIRILAWAHNPPDGFSARFNCRARHYRYFFTDPMLSPTNSGGTLDIVAMQTAAQYFLGSHDFRNFCKLDPGKQIDNFSRDILESSIEVLPGVGDGDTATTATTYYFNLKGTAFLWHQVRHMMAILFLVGQGLEKPEVVRDMLDMSLFPTKPMYEMADDRPLVLWDCEFPNAVLQWLVADDGELRGALADTTWMGWHEKKIDEILAGQLVGLVRRQLEENEKSPVPVKKKNAAKPGHVLILGSGEALLRGKYVPIQERKRMRPAAEINKCFIERKGDWRERRELKRKKKEAKGSE